MTDAINYYNYGKSPNVSPLQFQWQTNHIIWTSINQKNPKNRNEYIKSIHQCSSKETLFELSHAALLQPVEYPALKYVGIKPSLINYVQLPMYVWVPEWYYPDRVPCMPCPYNVRGSDGQPVRCTYVTKVHGWNPGGPRVVNDVHNSMYLHYRQYKCENPYHIEDEKYFTGVNSCTISRLPVDVQDMFTFFLLDELGVTQALLDRIMEARMSGSSLSSLQNEILRNQHSRMHRKIKQYYQDCARFKNNVMSKMFSLVNDVQFEDMPPVLYSNNAYHDTPVMAHSTMVLVYEEYGAKQVPGWINYTRSLTSDCVSVDATHKIAKKVFKGPKYRDKKCKLYSIVCVKTGCVLAQQLLVNEAHRDIEPLLIGYKQRVLELQQRGDVAYMPRRISSDRGFMDSQLFWAYFLQFTYRWILGTTICDSKKL